MFIGIKNDIHRYKILLTNFLRIIFFDNIPTCKIKKNIYR